MNNEPCEISVLRATQMSLLGVFSEQKTLSDWQYFLISTETEMGGRIVPDTGCFCHGMNEDTQRAVMIISGTHGAEFIPGHEMQMLVAQNYRRLVPKGTGIILVHGLNQYGCETGRRCDKNNVDFNRACCNDHGHDGGRDTSAYDSVRSIVEPDEMNSAYVDSFLRITADEWKYIVRIVVPGQYHSPKGMFYGGTSMPKELRTFKEVCEIEFGKLDHLAVIDIHTGVEGGAMVLSPLADARSSDAERVRKWFGDKVIFPNAGKTGLGYSGVAGDLLSAIARWMPETEVTSVALEMGTIPFAESFPLLVLENALHHHPEWENLPEFQALVAAGFSKDAFRKSFVPDNPLWWREMEKAFSYLLNSVVANF